MHGALLRAAERVKLKIDLDDHAKGLVGAIRFTKVGSLGGERLSRYLHCGSGFGGPYADTFRLMLTAVRGRRLVHGVEDGVHPDHEGRFPEGHIDELGA